MKVSNQWSRPKRLWWWIFIWYLAMVTIATRFKQKAWCWLKTIIIVQKKFIMGRKPYIVFDFLWFVCTQLNLLMTFKQTWKVSKEKKFNVALQFHAKNYTIWSFWFLKDNVQFLGALLYFEETQNATANVNFLISTRRLTSITKNNKVQDLHYILHFVKVKQHTHLSV